MPAPTIDQAFVTQFEEEVKLDYQRFGSRLTGLVRQSNQVVGSSVRFQLVGKGTATTKSRHGDIPVMNIDYSNVDATMVDSYAGELVDNLDALKTNIDTRSAVIRTLSAAMGRRADEHIRDLDTSITKVIGANTDGLTKAKVIAAQQYLTEFDVPADGERYMAIGAESWSNLLLVDEFVSADYVGQEDLPFKGGMQAKRYLDFLIFVYTGLTDPDADGTERTNLAWHKSAIGLGTNKELSVDVDWVPLKAAWLFAASASQGAVLIDQEGCCKIPCLET